MLAEGWDWNMSSLDVKEDEPTCMKCTLIKIFLNLFLELLFKFLSDKVFSLNKVFEIDF